MELGIKEAALSTRDGCARCSQASVLLKVREQDNAGDQLTGQK